MKKKEFILNVAIQELFSQRVALPATTFELANSQKYRAFIFPNLSRKHPVAEPDIVVMYMQIVKNGKQSISFIPECSVTDECQKQFLQRC